MNLIDKFFTFFSIKYFEKNIIKSLYILIMNSFTQKGILKLYKYDLDYYINQMKTSNSTYQDAFLYRQTKIKMDKYKNER